MQIGKYIILRIAPGILTDKTGLCYYQYGLMLFYGFDCDVRMLTNDKGKEIHL